MNAYLIKRGDDVVGYTTDETLADHLDGEEVHYDNYEYYCYTVEEVPNDDIV